MRLASALRLDQPRISSPRASAISLFEFWPSWAFYTPVVVHWLALGLRYRSFTLPSAANPRIDLGGLCGESKLAILGQVTGRARDLLAGTTGIVTHRWNAKSDLEVAEAALAEAGLSFPIVAKPDIGCNGTGVRLIQNNAELLHYLAGYPRETGLVLQEFLPQEGEAGLFYIRHPNEARGRITSVTLKYPPFVVGDGRSTLGQLVLADPRAGLIPHLYLPRLERRLHEVPKQGERVRLVFVGNHCKGSIFRNGTSLVSSALTDRVEELARALPDFHFGRIDVRFDSIPSLVRGEGFRVIEINGVGSEATHVWDPNTRLLDAWRAQFYHYGQAFRIGAANRARGHRSASVGALWRHWRMQKRLMASYPTND